MQNFDGLYPDNRALVSGLDIPMESFFWNPPPQAQGHNASAESIWATAIAVAYLRKRYPSQMTIWTSLCRKAMVAGSHACGSRELFRDVFRQALNML